MKMLLRAAWRSLALVVLLVAGPVAATPQQTLLFNGGVQPTLRVITAGGTAFDSRVTYTGASLKMDVDATGKLTYAPNNLLGFSTTLGDFSILSEVTKSSGKADSDGGSNAYLITPSTNNALHSITWNATTGIGNVCWSMNAKSNGYPRVGFSAFDGSAYVIRSVFDISAGTVISSTGGGVSTIAPLGNGWYQIATCGGSTTGVVGNTTGFYAEVLASGLSNQTAYVGDGTSGAFFYKPQIAKVTYQTLPPAYNATSGSAYFGPRFGYDPVTLAPLGYLSEEQRTNLTPHSQDTAGWTTDQSTLTGNSVVAPDGTTTATTLTDNAVSNRHAFFQAITTVSSTVYGASVFLKKNTLRYAIVNLSSNNSYAAVLDMQTCLVTATDSSSSPTSTSANAQVFGNGWCRLRMTSSAGGTSGFILIYGSDTGTPAFGAFSNYSYVGTGQSLYWWGADVEVTSTNYPGPTSYIPTVASTATRAADVASITGSAFSGFYNPLQGAFVATVTPPGDYNQFGTIAAVSDGTVSNTNELFKSSTAPGNPGKRWMAFATSSYTISQPVDGAAITAKLGVSFKSTNDAAFVADGVLVGSSSSFTFPSFSQLNIGTRGNGAASCNCHIKQLDYYRTRLPNFKLIQKTGPTGFNIDLPRIPANDDQPERMAA